MGCILELTTYFGQDSFLSYLLLALKDSVAFIFRYLLIECEDQEPAVKQDSKVREMYLTVMKTFSQVLSALL